MKKNLLLISFFTAFSLLTFAQDTNVSGLVKDESGFPIPM